MSNYPTRLMWTDLETTGLPVNGDYKSVHLLEIAVITTDFNLTPIQGYEAVIKMTALAAQEIRANDYVRQMHTKSGLLKDCVQSPDTTMEGAEFDIMDILDEDVYMIAGSGVAAYDHPFIKQKMPNLAAKLAYYPFDVGVLRRSSKILAGRDVVNPTLHSYGESKEHRALADVKAHLAEAKTFQEFFRNAVVPTH